MQNNEMIVSETFAISKKEVARIVREYEEKKKTMSDEDFETFITIIPHVD